MEYPKRIQALINYPRGGAVKKGEIGEYIGKGYYCFPSQSVYSVATPYSGGFKILEEESNYEIY